LVSRGVKVDNNIYTYFKHTARLYKNPLCCNCLLLSDNTIVQLTDTRFHLKYLFKIINRRNLQLIKYIKDLKTPFSLRMQDNKPVLFYENQELYEISFPPASDFYSQKTTLGTPFVGNAVLQGLDWVAFQCLWPCEYAVSHQACQFCFTSGLTQKVLPPKDLFAITDNAQRYECISHVQITGGSTIDGRIGAGYIRDYLTAMPKINGEILLYITPTDDKSVIDEYFTLGASRVAHSLEVWDSERAKIITPGKMNISGRDKHLQGLMCVSKGIYGNTHVVFYKSINCLANSPPFVLPIIIFTPNIFSNA
jgi:hypothetical protein